MDLLANLRMNNIWSCRNTEKYKKHKEEKWNQP